MPDLCWIKATRQPLHSSISCFRILLWFFFFMAWAVCVNAGRDIPDDNLAYPVLIKLSEGKTGSGFYLNTEKHMYLVTARHLLCKIDISEGNGTEKVTVRRGIATLISYPKDPHEQSRNILIADLEKLNEAGAIMPHAVHDVAIVRIADASMSDGQRTVSLCTGVTIKEKSKSGFLGVGIENLKRFNEVLTANEVFLFGYPTSLGMKEMPQLDHSQPLLRKGIVAGKNTTSKSIILDCPVYKGNSGGPVLEVEHVGLQTRFRVIGVVSQFVPFAERWENRTQGYWNTSISNSGYSIAVSSDFILDLIQN